MKESLTFGGVNSADYGVWLTGSGTFGAPERDIEYVSVPGRNGDLALDNGRYENIEVTYPANIPTDFGNKLEAFRAALCRQRGYQRLEDSYHPDEYRLGVFGSGMDPDVIPLNRGGDFKLAFTCKPQRFLKSGELPIQLMPIDPAGFRSQYMPIEGGEIRVRPVTSETEIELTFTQYSASYEQTSTVSVTWTAANVWVDFNLDSSARYWRLEVSNGITDIDKTYLQIEGATKYGNKRIALNAIMGRTFIIQNPTGYATKPLIECYASMLPYTAITNYDGNKQVSYYDFHSDRTGKTHFYMDCEMQYLYDDQKKNLTSKLFITDMQSDFGEALTFPEFGDDKIEVYAYYPGGSDHTIGLGLIFLYPRWWRL